MSPVPLRATKRGSRLRRHLAVFLLAAAFFASELKPAGRPNRHPEFAEGFRAYKQGQWKTAVIKMRQAQQRWPEDGERTRTYGRWTEPYLPRYYIGAALSELGCCREALDQFELSLFGRVEIPDTEDHRRPAELEEECASRVVVDDCSNWRQWHENGSDP